MGVALGLADLGVTEDLLDDADADALLQQQSRGGVLCTSVRVTVAQIGHLPDHLPAREELPEPRRKDQQVGYDLQRTHLAYGDRLGCPARR